ncbi:MULTISPECIES: LysE family transporter [Pseudomonas]|jgi:RhtB (resistance to homoserine/threonine) family protein|uniref:RhtB (Resistance to homoserine/threonine) family protein n=2 Tax=Pseudomonas TaxID=286 RepID=A0A9X8HM74_PSEPU|nr:MULTISPECIES: LysE family transporter [Pseudomonas]KIU43695.1 lysine transporter LysE [Pseudomonas putida]KTC24371.1 lysine transporter LysE [Pseudomonas putida]MCO7504894.1 LysE family transporter [Pseudomonas sp. VE 267-6A]MCO7531285.1 LysE family transporter [Pseudomonas sp. 2]MCP8350692.1 LysE family translocator [Pseudomonas sp. FBF18]
MYWAEFLTVALIHLLAVASPGPDFAVVVRESVTHGRRAGTWTAFGVGTAIFLHVGYSLLGIGLIVSQSIMLFNVLKWLAAAYLVYIGIKALRARPAPAGSESVQVSTVARTPRAAFVAGFMTNGLNPKATLFFLSLFTVVINPHTPLLIQAGYGAYLALATGLWFCLVALLFSHARVRSGFARMGHWFDRGMGAVLVALGIKIAFTEMH